MKPLDFRNINLDQNRIVLYKHSQLLAERYVTIQISRNSKKFFIVAFDLDERKPHLIDLTDKQAQKLIGQCQSSIEQIVERLDFTPGGKFIIRDWNKIDYTSYHNTQYYLQNQSQQQQRSGSVSAGQSGQSAISTSRQKKIHTGRTSSNLRSNPEYTAAVARSDDLRRYNKIKHDDGSKIQEEDQAQNYFYKNSSLNKNVRAPPQIDLFERGLIVQPQAKVSQRPDIDEDNQGDKVQQSLQMRLQDQESGKQLEEEDQEKQHKNDELMDEARQMHSYNVNSGIKASTSQDYYQDEFQKIQTERKMGIQTVPEQRSKDQESNITGQATIPNTKVDSQLPQSNQIQQKEQEQEEEENQGQKQEEADQLSNVNEIKQNQSQMLPFKHLEEQADNKDMNATSRPNINQQQIDKELSDILQKEPAKVQNMEELEGSSKKYQNEMPVIPFDQGVSTIKPANTSVHNTRENLIIDSMIQKDQNQQLNASSPNLDKNHLQNISQKYPESVVPLSPQQKENSQIEFTQIENQGKSSNDRLDEHRNQKNLNFQNSKASNLQELEPKRDNDEEDEDDNHLQLPNLIANQLQFSPSEQTPINVDHKTKTVPGSVIQKSISIQKEGQNATPPQYGDLSHQELAHIQQLSYQPSPVKDDEDDYNGDNSDNIRNSNNKDKSGEQDQIIAQSYADTDLPSDLRKDLMNNNERLSATFNQEIKQNNNQVKSEQGKTAILVEQEQKQRNYSQDQDQYTHVQREVDEQSQTAQRGQSPRDPDDILDKMSNPQERVEEMQIEGQEINTQFEMLENENEKLDAIPEQEQVENGTPSPTPLNQEEQQDEEEEEEANLVLSKSIKQEDNQSEAQKAKDEEDGDDDDDQQQIIRKKQNIVNQTDSEQDFGNQDDDNNKQ